ncbi:tyrosyl-DNA phosphodiesterase-domain-containing protein [Collybia nuda]|uniref:Tyrosyl-DNA phosphodiesterase-domain-containing protein n=1 Tax=Collybia nuda TaxID=64659 RepID=A0A9P6CD30_9AGAR|nr:tyrosyl-DNA phosphodiesterase-domain-containing protein [Collybia nuda]
MFFFSSAPWAFGVFLIAQTVTATLDFPVIINTTSPLTLAIKPACGTLDSATFTEINTGINLSATRPFSHQRTIVAFGDSWTSNGANGSIPVPPIVWPPSPSAGSRITSNRRASNGFVWVEVLANSLGAKLLNYAWGGAIIDNFAWNTTSPLNKTASQRTDFVAETKLFLLQGRYLDSLVPSQTLYTVAFGINDEGQYEIAGGDWDLAYDTYTKKLDQLQASGAKNILIHGMYKSHPNSDILQNKIFQYLRNAHVMNGTAVAFVNLERLFTAISSDPSPFGYRGNPTCLISTSTSNSGYSHDFVRMNANEDDDIVRAIALSLADLKKPEVINLESDTEEEDDEEIRFQAELQRALNTSKAEASRTSRENAKSSAPELQAVIPTSAFLSERAKLEKERRERQKRLRPDVIDDDHDHDSGREDDEPPAKRQRLSSSSGVRADKGKANTASLYRSSSSASAAVPTTNVPTIEQVFWGGEFRQTATRHAEPRKDGQPTFRLTEILGKKSDLSFAIMSSYSLDFSWIYEFFDRSVPVIMVAQPDATGQPSLKNVLPNWIKTTPLLRGGRGCMHMKFMLLFYKTGRLRVVVSTANLIAYDYRDMENTVWLQDLPLRSSRIPHDPKVTDDFASVLQRVLYSVNVEPALKTMIKDNVRHFSVIPMLRVTAFTSSQHPDLPLKAIEELRMFWDWSKVKAHLVPSIAGKHEGWPAVVKTGHPRLMVINARHVFTWPEHLFSALTTENDPQGSSLGNYTTQWLNEFHWSARGESAEDWLDEPKKRREKLPFPSVKVVFPTRATVQKSQLGEEGGGTIFCRRKQWVAKNFPRDHFYDSKSKGGPVLMHSKMILATYKVPSSSNNRNELEDSETEDDSDSDVQIIQPAIGWAYIGSHNFTPSAWGTLSGSGFNPILNISNYELGVMFPLKDEAAVDRVACWERPPKKYARGNDEPWMQEESIYHQDG